VYTFPLSSKSLSKNAVFDFDIPTIVSNVLPVRISAFDVSVDDLCKVSKSSVFIPCGIIVSVEPKVKIVTGNVFTAPFETATDTTITVSPQKTKSEDFDTLNNNKSSCLRYPAVYIQSTSEASGSIGCFTTFRAVACWNPLQQSTVKSVTIPSFQRRGLLALSSDGTTLKYLPFVNGGVLPKSETFTLPAVATGIWSPSAAGISLRRVLFSISTGSDVHNNNNSVTQRLVISDVDQVLFNGNSVGVQLHNREQVLDVVWGADGRTQSKQYHIYMNIRILIHLCLYLFVCR